MRFSGDITWSYHIDFLLEENRSSLKLEIKFFVILNTLIAKVWLK